MGKRKAKSVVIVESPAKARTIGRYLGADYAVVASMGHVRDLPKRKLGIDLDHGYEATYEIIPSRSKVVNQLKREVKGGGTVYLAADPDREGEAIAWHLIHALAIPEDKARRVTFNEITKDAILRAFEGPGPIDMAKVDAQQARRLLDRLVGYQLSPLLWKKVARGLSAGRVQSVAVRLIAEREKEIQAFVAEEYWKITARFAPPDRADDESAQFEAGLSQWDGKAFKATEEGQASAIVDELKGQTFCVSRLEQKDRVDKQPPPFQTSSLQQQASIRLRFSAKRTMALAQQLYEGIELGGDGAVGLITYMRTDSLRVNDDAVKACRAHIEQHYGQQYLPKQAHRYKAGKRAQEAHEAVRPTSMDRPPEALASSLSPDQLKLYRLIWNRFVASQMAPARFAITDVEVQAGRGLFKAQGKHLKFDGYLKAFPPPSAQQETLLPPLAEDQELTCLALEPSQHFTQPPPRYSEATLVRALEKQGIGRPSTYAPIISTIQQRGYVRQEKRRFLCTELGMHVTDLLVKHFPKIMDVAFTSHMEDELDQIEQAQLAWRKVLDEFYGPFKQALDKAREGMKTDKGKPEPTGETCEKCGAPMVYRWSKAGKFLGCLAFPECKFIKSLNNNGGSGESVETDHKCPTCGKPLMLRDGPRGQYFACLDYPDCKTTMRMGKDGVPVPAAIQTEHKCEKCGEPMVIRNGRNGPFLGCSAYPKCRNTKEMDADGRPMDPITVEEKCDKCGADMTVRSGRRGKFLGCSAYPKCKSTKPLPAELKEKLQQRTQQKAEAYSHIKIDRTCPECGAPMAIREGRRGPFLGCTAYPKCKTAEPLPDDIKQQLDQR